MSTPDARLRAIEYRLFNFRTIDDRLQIAWEWMRQEAGAIGQPRVAPDPCELPASVTVDFTYNTTPIAGSMTLTRTGSTSACYLSGSVTYANFVLAQNFSPPSCFTPLASAYFTQQEARIYYSAGTPYLEIASRRVGSLTTGTYRRLVRVYSLTITNPSPWTADLDTLISQTVEREFAGTIDATTSDFVTTSGGLPVCDQPANLPRPYNLTIDSIAE